MAGLITRCPFICIHSFILEHAFNECFLCARHLAGHWSCDVEQHIVPGREEANGSVLWVKQADLRMVLIDKRRRLVWARSRRGRHTRKPASVKQGSEDAQFGLLKSRLRVLERLKRRIKTRVFGGAQGMKDQVCWVVIQE